MSLIVATPSPHPNVPATVPDSTVSDPLPAPAVPTSPEQPLFGFQRQSAEELARVAAAEQRTFTKPARLTALLYLAFWVPGLVANIRYLRQAHAVEHVIGYSPKGIGCLWALLIVCVGLPSMLICMSLGLFIAGGS